MTVKHLQSVQRQQLNMAIQTDPGVVHKFKTGFVECAEEVNRYVSQMEGIEPGVRQRLSAHLNNCANSLEQIGSMSNFNSGYRGQIPPAMFPAAAAAAAAPLFPPLPQDLNNNNSGSNSSRDGITPAAPAIQMGGLHLIPSRLPSGEFALIMPNTATAGTTAPAPAPFVWPPGAAVNAASAALASIANPTHLNDYAQSFRLSAFNKPAAPVQTQLQSAVAGVGAGAGAAVVNAAAKNTASSPPLSPISSISSHSHGEESRAASPASAAQAELLLAKQHSFAGVFSTPPPTSAETSFNSSGSLNLSTASHDTSGSLCNNNNNNSSRLQQQQVSSTSGQETGSMKREREREVELEREREQADSSDCSLSDEPSSKKFLAAASEKSSSAWRPW